MRFSPSLVIFTHDADVAEHISFSLHPRIICRLHIRHSPDDSQVIRCRSMTFTTFFDTTTTASLWTALERCYYSCRDFVAEHDLALPRLTVHLKSPQLSIAYMCRYDTWTQKQLRLKSLAFLAERTIYPLLFRSFWLHSYCNDS